MPRRVPLALEIVVLGGLVAVLHYVVSASGLYWSISWIDTVVHFLGGTWIGLLATFVFFTAGWVRLPGSDPRTVLVVTLLSVAAVGLAWELYEAYAGLVNVPGDLLDTLSDLACDTLGGLAAALYCRAALVREPAGTSHV